MPNTREKLIELLSVGHDCPDGRNPFVEESCSTCPYEKAKNCGAEIQADHLIANGVTVQKWIPVAERLPEKNKMVFVYCKDKTIRGLDVRHIGSCDNGFWFLKAQPGTASFPHLEWEVTHWMPLPEPPKEV